MTGLAGHLRTIFTNHVPKYHTLHERGSVYSPPHPDEVGCVQQCSSLQVGKQVWRGRVTCSWPRQRGSSVWL